MKALKYLLLCFTIGLCSCSEEALNPVSIFQDSTQKMNDFDTWLYNNYTQPYNIKFNYKYVDIETDQTYNLVPAEQSKALALAKLVKYLWIDSYVEINKTVDPSFLQTYCPKVIQLIGSAAWNKDNSRILGQAEGGLKITLYEVNAIDLNNINVATMNDLWFHTMHHEFCHILNQQKEYSTDFKLITNADYNSSGWTNLSDLEALHLGFISAYASSEPDEDFVETASLYITHDQTWWDGKMALAKETEVSKSDFDKYVDTKGTKTIRTTTAADGTITYHYIIVYNGDQKLKQKLSLVSDYFATKWNFSLEDLRTIVQRRSASIGTLDLTSYK